MQPKPGHQSGSSDVQLGVVEGGSDVLVIDTGGSEVIDGVVVDSGG